MPGKLGARMILTPRYKKLADLLCVPCLVSKSPRVSRRPEHIVRHEFRCLSKIKWLSAFPDWDCYMHVTSCYCFFSAEPDKLPNNRNMFVGLRRWDLLCDLLIHCGRRGTDGIRVSTDSSVDPCFGFCTQSTNSSGFPKLCSID
jgi:hypothetical protein